MLNSRFFKIIFIFTFLAYNIYLRESDYNKHVKISTERISKPIEQLGTNTNGKQMDKLAEMGGRLVEKRKSEEFEGVELPQFNSKQDPTGPGEVSLPKRKKLINL